MYALNQKLKHIAMLVEGDGTEGGGGGGAPAEKPAEKTLTQTEVNAIAAREKNEGKAAAQRELAEQLGVSIEDAKAIIKRSQEVEDGKKSEADKDREAAAKEKQAAEADRAAAKKEVHEARLERAFAKEGFDTEADAAKAARLLRMVTVEPGATYEDVLKDVQAVKADFPALFGDAVTGEPKKKAPNGDPKGNPPKPTGGEDKYDAGAKRAQALYSKTAFDPLAKK